MIYESILDLIGNTPLIRVKKFENIHNFNNEIYLKLEKFNPGGSLKDRASFAMIKNALDEGEINNETVIIEPTSGNTGISLAFLGNVFNLKVIIVMPSSMSEERRKLIKDYGAILELVDGNMEDCVIKAKELCSETPNSFMPAQFDNQNNPLIHYNTTAIEIINDLPSVDIVVIGIGSGGTISGVGKRLKEYNPLIKIIGVEPFSSPIISKGYANKHKIQGIGAGFVPKILDISVVDEIILVKDEDALNSAKEITHNEGLYVGISSGAVISAIKQISQFEKGKKILGILPDGGERYQWN